MPRRYHHGRALHVKFLVVEEHMRAEGAQHLVLGQAAEEERLVDGHVPRAQRMDDARMRGTVARGHDGDAHRARARRKMLLDLRQPQQQLGERALGHGLVPMALLMPDKRLESLLLVDAFRLRGKQHGIAIEGNADLSRRGLVVGRHVIELRGGHAAVDRGLHIGGIAREKQVHLEGLQVARDGFAAGERRARDIELAGLDGIEGAQAGIGRIARDHHHLDQAPARNGVVEFQQRAYQRVGGARSQRFVFVRALVRRIGGDSLVAVDAVLQFQVEQRPRGNADHELVGEVVGHAQV